MLATECGGKSAGNGLAATLSDNSVPRRGGVQARNEGMGQMAWPVLAELDKLAGVELTVPVVLTTYSGGASCDGSRAAAKRSATVRSATALCALCQLCPQGWFCAAVSDLD